MLPNDFMDRFGTVTPRVIRVAAGAVGNIPPDPGRYLLVFWSATTLAEVVPAGADFPALAAATIGGGSPAIILTHALHGAMVNIGWVVRGSGGIASDVVIIEGFMREKSSKRKG